MPFNPRVFFRKAHRLGAVAVAVPLLLVVVTGILLQLRKEIAWVQPPTQKGQGKIPTVSMDAILGAAKSVPEAGVATWADIDRVDVRPKDGIVKVQCRSRWEVQVDFQTGSVLQAAVRRNELIEGLHDGSWFADAARVYVFLPAAVVLLGLWATGLYLWLLPWSVRWRRRTPSAPAVPGRS
jgi:uncharacterized iron-regulated membrane protein